MTSQELEERIVRQVNFYFSDDNLCTDYFLRSHILKNPKGFVEIDLLMKFNRILSLSSDRNLVISALQMSDALELNVDRSCVRRKSPLLPQEETKADLKSRTLVISNFPSHGTLKCGEVEEFLRKEYADQVSVIKFIRNTNKQSRPWLGKVFVVFSDHKYLANAIESHRNDLSPLVYLGTKLKMFLKMPKTRTEEEELKDDPFEGMLYDDEFGVYFKKYERCREEEGHENDQRRVDEFEDVECYRYTKPENLIDIFGDDRYFDRNVAKNERRWYF